MLLLNKDKVVKLFSILSTKSRHIENRYNGNCGKQVFIRRALARLKGSYIKIYDGKFDVTKFLKITNVSFKLGYSDSLMVTFVDYSRIENGICSKEVYLQDLLDIEGVFCEDSKAHDLIKEIFSLSIPERTFRFEAHDFSKFDDKLSIEENKNKISTFVDIKARTKYEAFSKKKDYDKVIIGLDYEVVDL